MRVGIILLLGAASLFAGCQTYFYTPEQRSQDAMRMKSSTRMLEERVRSAEGRAEAAETEVARLSQDLEKLYAELRSQNAQVARVNDSMRALERKQASDRQEIISQTKMIVNEIIKNIKTAPTPRSGHSGPGRRHVVESGHTLSAIAQAYGTTVKSIKQANNLRSDNIRVGQELFIPQ